MTTTTHFASQVDTETYGEYSIVRHPDDNRPLYRFTDRLGPGAEAGRYHLYSGWFCPWAHRSTLVVALAGIESAVSVSYVDGGRDARGWGFREQTGPDPVNGFSFLRQAYEATEPGFDGHVSVPTLWDRQENRIHSNDYSTLDSDLATAFSAHSSTGLDLYPLDRRDEIERLDRWISPTVNHGVQRAARPGAEGDHARNDLASTFAELDASLRLSRYLLGDRLTLADVRLWVTLVRYDVGANAEGRAGKRLEEYPALWDYARDLFQHRAFRATTRLGSFTRSGATPPRWEAPVDRSDLDE